MPPELWRIRRLLSRAKQLRKLNGPDFDLAVANAMAQAALAAVRQGKLGYAIICGTKEIQMPMNEKNELGKVVRTACGSL